MDKTEHYKLSLPGPDDPVDIEVLDGNFRTLDEKLHEEAEAGKTADSDHAAIKAAGSISGHVTLSDSTDSTSGAENGVAATPKAVNEVKKYAVTGPTSSTDGDIPVFNGANGRSIKGSGRSFPLNTADISDGAVTSAKLADKSVSSEKIQTGAVTQGKIQDGSITEGKLADKSVSENKLQAGSVSQGKIKDGAVTEGKIAEKAVTISKIDPAGTKNKVLVTVYENNKLETHWREVDSSMIMDGQINTAELADKAVSADKIQAGAVTQPKIQDNAVTEGKIHDGAVTSSKLADNAVTSGKIADHVIQKSDLTDSLVEWIESQGASELLKRFNNGKAPAVSDMQLLYGDYRILSAYGTPAEYEYYLSDVGSLNDLETTDKGSVVEAINSIVRAISEFALSSDISNAISKVNESIGKTVRMGPDILCARLLGYTVYCGSNSSFPFGAYTPASEFNGGNAFIIGSVSRTFDIEDRTSTIVNYGTSPISVRWTYIDNTASYPTVETRTNTVKVGEKLTTGYPYSAMGGSGFIGVTVEECDIIEEMKSTLKLNSA